MKSNKGITLIALIITILVMVILAAVTMKVLFGEDGIISRANESAKKMERETIYDKIVGASIYKTNGNIDVKQTFQNAEETLEAQKNKVTMIYPDNIILINNGVRFNVVEK